MFYREWGFTGNPLLTEALPPSELGSKLLVGRDGLIKSLRKRLDSPSKIATVEGLNGVGKTSLVNVTIYRSYVDYLLNKSGPLYIPCRSVFQLDASQDAELFRQKVLMEVAQTLIEKVKTLKVPPGKVRAPKGSAISKFLNDPQLHSYSAGAWVLNAGYSSETNTGVGFEKSGFDKAVVSWLQEIFPSQTSGGVVCIIDNLELLQTSRRARETLESLRDNLFSIPGIRWVLCGALGIIHGVASSPRLDGRLHKPVTVDDVGDQFAGMIFSTRVEAFRSRANAKLPLELPDFVEVFDMMRGNIRSTLSECDDFCSWAADDCESVEDFSDGMFEIWLKDELEVAYEGVRGGLRPAAAKVFDMACRLEIFSPGDCDLFGYQNTSAMRPQIKILEDLGLIVSSIDDSDKRRKTIQVTPKGWKIRSFLDANTVSH